MASTIVRADTRANKARITMELHSGFCRVFFGLGPRLCWWCDRRWRSDGCSFRSAALAEFQLHATVAEIEAALVGGLISEVEAYAAAAWPKPVTEPVHPVPDPAGLWGEEYPPGFVPSAGALDDRTLALELVSS